MMNYEDLIQKIEEDKLEDVFVYAISLWDSLSSDHRRQLSSLQNEFIGGKFDHEFHKRLKVYVKVLSTVLNQTQTSKEKPPNENKVSSDLVQNIAVANLENSSFFWQDQGDNAIHKGDYQGAIDCYTKSLDLLPDNPSVWYNLAIAYKSTNKSNLAKKFFKKVVYVDPTNAMAWFALAQTNVMLEKFTEANEAITVALERAPDIYDYLVAAANIDIKINGVSQASILFYKKACDQQPHSAEAWLGLGSSYRVLGEYNKAIDTLQVLLEIDPYNFEGWLCLGQVLPKGSRAAIDAFEQATQLESKNSTAWAYLAKNYQAAQQYTFAIHAYEQLGKLDAAVDRHLLDLGHCYLTNAQYQSAIRVLNKYIEQGANEALAWGYLADAYIAEKQGSKAQEALRKYLSIKPNDQTYQRKYKEVMLANSIDFLAEQIDK